MEPIPTHLPQRNVFSFPYTNQDGQTHKITFNSIFDSGNLRQVICASNGTYILHTAPDCCGTPYEGTQKSWFHFGITGVPNEANLYFTIKRIGILYSMFKTAPENYKPVYKIGEGPWRRAEGKCVVVEDPIENTIDVKFSHTFYTPEEEVFFAFSYPFSYEESQELLNQYDKLYLKDQDIYYHREVMIHSPQNRLIDLITISSHEGKLAETESPLDENLFPYGEPRAYKFRLNKPVILITARVHPGETPASHTMNGILKFLLDKKDIRAQYLRKYFVFMLIPMINPDGVANGHYRMDAFNQNLNRYYKNPDLRKQPSNFAIRKLVEYLHSENRLFFFCDLHAHAAKKGCFLYGNALDFVMQVESILFTKIMGLNCINFEDKSCNFSEKHMRARDKGEKLTKEGAARVCVYKLCNLVHSYTMECGLHFSSEVNRIAMPSSAGNKEWHEDEVSDINSDMYKDTPTYYNIEIYQNLGKSMLVSLLDTFEKNPCSRLQPGTLENLRKEIATRLSKIPRFWKESNMKKKCTKINEVVKETFYDEFHRKQVFSRTFNIETNLVLSAKKNALMTIHTANVARSYKKSLTNLNQCRPRDLRTSITVECSMDENVEQEQEEEEMETEQRLEADTVEQQILPRVKTPHMMKEFRIKQVIDMKVPQMDRVNREENMLANLDKKSPLQSTMRPSDRGILVNSELMNGREIFSPNKTNLMIKDGKIQPFAQQNSMENIKAVKKVALQPPPKGGNPLERKKTTTLATKLPDLEQGGPETPGGKDQFFLIIGGRNYMVSQPKSRLTTKNTTRKLK